MGPADQGLRHRGAVGLRRWTSLSRSSSNRSATPLNGSALGSATGTGSSAIARGISAGVPRRARRRRLARHLHARGLWRRRPRRLRSRDHDADDRGVGGRAVGRVRGTYEHFRAQPGRRVRQRGAEAPHAAADRDGREKACFAVTEPNVGLDTSRLQTRALRKGAHYVVSGSKIWISTAQIADKMLILTRTTPIEQAAKPTQGLTLFYTSVRPAFHRGARDRQDGPQGGRLQPGVHRRARSAGGRPDRR